tara:strand:+ start:62 stop:565 length:504 start_codon:yes stop_codon:yes gene_type:complete
MQTFLQSLESNDFHPIDIVEDLMIDNHWEYDRVAENNLYLEIGGKWADYQISFTWLSQSRILQFSCAYDMRVPKKRMNMAFNLISNLNQKLNLGHFEIWEEDRWPMFRYSLPVPNGKKVDITQLEMVCIASISECELYYPVFQFVLWGNNNAEEAISKAMLETHGVA